MMQLKKQFWAYPVPLCVCKAVTVLGFAVFPDLSSEKVLLFCGYCLLGMEICYFSCLSNVLQDL